MTMRATGSGFRRGNLKVPHQDARDREVVATLVEAGGVRIEQVVSRGQVSPPGFWFDQEEDEFVLLIGGAAELDVDGEGIVPLGPGDWVELPAHLRHRVKWTHPDVDTVWLAVFRRPLR